MAAALAIALAACSGKPAHGGSMPVDFQAEVGRQLPYDPGRALIDQVPKGEKRAMFLRDSEDERVLPDRPLTERERLSLAVAGSPIVAVIEVVSTSSYLIDGGRWIASRVGCRIVEQLKKAANASSDEPLAFQVGIGTLTIGDVRVTAGQSVPYRAGQRYLAFLREQPDRARALTHTVAGAFPHSVVDGRLHAVPGYGTDLEGIEVSAVRREILVQGVK